MTAAAGGSAAARAWLTAALLAVAVAAGSGWVDRRAAGFYEDAFQRALVTFALARTLNGVISVVQGTEVAVEPAGVGVTLTPGEIVDPVNDLIERFSWVMLASTTSLGVQQVLMEMSGWSGTRLAAAAAALLALVLVWAGEPGSPARRWALRLVLLAAFLRFAMPVMVLLNHAAYGLFMAEDYTRASQVISDTTQRLAELSESRGSGEPQNWMERARGWLGDRAAELDIGERLDRFQDQLSAATEHLLRLTAVFVLQTIVLPLLFLWGLAAAARGLARLR